MSAISRAIEKTVNSAVGKALDKLLPAAVGRVIRERLAKNPSAQLTPVGFEWAVSIAMEKHWPNLADGEAVRFIRDYIGVPFGTPGYDWSSLAAEELVQQYVSEFGE